MSIKVGYNPHQPRGSSSDQFNTYAIVKANLSKAGSITRVKNKQLPISSNSANDTHNQGYVKFTHHRQAFQQQQRKDTMISPRLQATKQQQQKQHQRGAVTSNGTQILSSQGSGGFKDYSAAALANHTGGQSTKSSRQKTNDDSNRIRKNIFADENKQPIFNQKRHAVNGNSTISSGLFNPIQKSANLRHGSLKNVQGHQQNNRTHRMPAHVNNTSQDSAAMHTHASLQQNKTQFGFLKQASKNTYKSVLNQQEDKENRSDEQPVLKQAPRPQSKQLLRSKTTDPKRVPLRQKDMNSVSNTKHNENKILVKDLQPDEVKTNKFSSDRYKEIAEQFEQRKKQRIKEQNRNLEVHDLLNLRDPQSVAEYVPCILKNMIFEEQKTFLCRPILANQSEINDKMRAYLMDWLAELHYKFKMKQETFYLAVQVIDNYLKTTKNFPKKDLQCMGITSLHIAGKYEEIYPPELRTILRVTENAVPRSQIIDMEQQILNKLNFDIHWASTHRFAERFISLAQFRDKQIIVANYLCDLAQIDHLLAGEMPSKLACAVIYLSHVLFKGGDLSNNQTRNWWNSTLCKQTGYKFDQISEVVNRLKNFIKKMDNSTLQTIQKKYSTERKQQVCKLVKSLLTN